MKFKVFAVIFYSVFLDASVQGLKIHSESQVKEKVYRTFESIYFHLAYISYFLARRSTHMSNTKLSLLSYRDQLALKSSQLFKLLGFDPKVEFPNVTSTLIIDPTQFEINRSDFEDLGKMESKIKDSLKIIQESLDIWKQYFEGGFGIFLTDYSKLQNDNVYRITFNDLLLIFFDVANEIIETYKVQLNKVKPEEIYAKSIYTQGLMYYRESHKYSGVEGESSVVLLSKRSKEANLDLLKRMFADIEYSLKPPTPEIETLIKLFKSYNETFKSL